MRSPPTVGWTPADCTSLLRDGEEASRAACIFSAATRLDALFAQPASCAAAQQAFCAHLRPTVSLDQAADFADIVAEVTGLSIAHVPQRLELVAAQCFLHPDPSAAKLGFWASAAFIFLTASRGTHARAIVRWLQALPFATPDDRVNAGEFLYALTALLRAPGWDSNAGAQCRAADLRSQALPRVDACLLPSPPGQRLTREQAAVVDANYPPGVVARVVAFAGAGKTSTLLALAAAHPEWRILYTAFNASVVADGKKAFELLDNVTCATTHVIATPARHELQSGNKKLRTNPMSVRDVCTAFPGSEAKHLLMAMAAADAFLVSDAERVQAEHMQLRGDTPSVTVLALANQIATRMMDPDDDFPFTFNAYLRHFVLSGPQLPYDCICVDESQDLNPITVRLFLAQTHARRIFVGDSHQHIYAFNGTRDCLTTLPVDMSFRLTRSFRFGADLSALADKLLFLKGEGTPLRGGRGRVTSIDVSNKLQPEHFAGDGCVLGVVRFNVSWIELAFEAGLLGASVYIETPAAARQFINLAEDVYKVAKRRTNTVSQANRYRLSKFQSLDELELEAMMSAQHDLRILAKLVRKHTMRSDTFPEILQQLRHSCLDSQEGARALLSTCHKAKGCEHDHVFVCEDLAQQVLGHQTDNGRMAAQAYDDLNLLYVGITRARRRLTLPSDLAQQLDTYAELWLVPVGESSPCISCHIMVQGGVYMTRGASQGRTCAACAALAVKLGVHCALHYTLLRRLAPAT